MNAGVVPGVRSNLGALAALLLLVVMLGTSGVVAASTRMPVRVSPILCAPGMRSIDARSQCFSPAQASAAERQMSVPVVTPRGLVWHMSGLALSELSIEREGSGVAAINYLFGRLPLDPTAPASAAVPLYGAPRPHYVLVREFVRHKGDIKRVLFRDNSAGGGAWHFVSSFADRNLAVSITTNGSKRIAERIGSALVRRGAGSR